MFWETDSFGTCPESDNDFSSDNFLQGLSFTNSHYKVDLPWCHDRCDLPVYYQLCYNRLKSLQLKLLRKPTILMEYQQVVEDQIRKSIIKQVEATSQQNASSVHYMPHHPMV